MKLKIPLRRLDDYADIIDHSRPKAARPMPRSSRAAQFSPYAALSGHQELIHETEQQKLQDEL